MAQEVKNRKGRVDEILCLQCKRWTKHTINGVYDTEWTDEEYGYSEWSEHDLLSCNGCNSVTYRERTWSSGSDDCSTKLFPPRGGPNPREPRDFSSLKFGSPIESVYRQTITAYNDQLPTLTGAGVRLLIEGICKDHGIADGSVTDSNGITHRKDNLEGRINGMVEKGFISGHQADTLHEIRFLGNDAAHELDQPAPEVQEAALDIVEHILSQVYELPAQTSALRARKRPAP